MTATRAARGRVAILAAIVGLAVLAAAAGVALPPATAGVAAGAPAPPVASPAQVVFFGRVGNPYGQQQVPVRMGGRIVVQFQGDPAAGCAARGLCGDSGVVIWSAPARGSLSLLRTRTGYSATLFPEPAGPLGTFGGVTTAAVTDSAAAAGDRACVDAASFPLAFQLPVGHGRIRFDLAQASPSVLATRCAGPRDASILPLLPVPAVRLAAIRHGHRVLAIDVSRSFAADGFSGNITADLTISLGRAGRPSAINLSGARRRALRLVFRAAVSGSVAEQVTGDADPSTCGPLGACGTQGTITIRPRAGHGTADIGSVAPAGRPAPGLHAAAGLGPARPRLTMFGSVFWRSAGSVTAQIAGCTDTARLAGGTIALLSTRHRLRAVYNPLAASGGPAQTACPGPLPTSLATAAATGSVPLARLADRRITIRLRSGARALDDGYRIRTVPGLILTLTRVRTSVGGF